ncbi:MAG: LAGLIDADG family homing endonuclease [Candidatus Pacearchaeota archaeon]
MGYVKELTINGFKSFAGKAQLPFDTGINVIIGPNGSGKCLTENSLVQLSDGTIEKIGNIVNSRLINAIKTEDGFLIQGDGTEVLCLDFNTLKVVKKPIKAFVKRTSPEKLLKIKTRSGREITSTKYHPFFILKNNKIVPAKAEELKKGVRIAVTRKINFEPENKYFIELLDKFSLEDNFYIPYKEEYVNILKSLKEKNSWRELAQKIGVNYYIIKGMLDKQSIHFCNLIKIFRYAGFSDIEIVNNINTICANGKDTRFEFKNSPDFARFFGYLLAEGRLGDSSHIWFTNGDREIVEDYVYLVRKLFHKEPLVREYKQNCWDVIIFSEPLKKILRELGMASKTENKKISNIILKHSSKEEISNLLNGLYCGDGYVSKKSPVIEITTKSELLCHSIETCLLRLGILFNTKDIIKGYKDFKGKYKSITISGVLNLALFNQYIQLIHKRKKDRILSHLHKKSNTNVDLIEANDLVKIITNELGISVKKNKQDFPSLDSYYYNQCTPSRNGLSLLTNQLFIGNSENINRLNLLIQSDIFWDELIDIQEIAGGEWVYDLCVEEHHNFVANNIFAHNSNISDALCFVLGRLSSKSLRAEKSSHLIFQGTKERKPSKEASVEIVFDNSDKMFNIDSKDVSIKRIVRRKGTSIYKLNGETKTRQEILELLSHAGIDPNGFNIVLQGEIAHLVKMHPIERREIIEEVAGISIYEMRKQKSLHEIEKTNQKLKEVSAVLRERTAYMKNLEEERKQALRFKELEKSVKQCKVSIIKKNLDEKDKEIEKIKEEVDKNTKFKEKVKSEISRLEQEIKSLSQRADEINEHVQKSSGFERESLNDEITMLNIRVTEDRTRIDNFDKKLAENEVRRNELEHSLKESEEELNRLKKESPLLSKRQNEIKAKKQELDEIESKKEKVYSLQTEFNLIKDRIRDKERELTSAETESRYLFNQIKSLAEELTFQTTEECTAKIKELNKDIGENKKQLEKLYEERKNAEKSFSVIEADIERNQKLKSKIPSSDICPLCQSKLTSEHVTHVLKSTEDKIKKSLELLNSVKKEIEDFEINIKNLGSKDDSLKNELSEREVELVKIESINEKRESMKKLMAKEKNFKIEIQNLKTRQESLAKNLQDISKIEEKSKTLLFELQEISSRTDENIDRTILFKEQEIERIRIVIKGIDKDKIEIKKDLSNLNSNLKLNEHKLGDRQSALDDMIEKFEKLFKERTEIQEKINQKNLLLVNQQNTLSRFTEVINNLKVEIAKVGAEKESFEFELREFSGIEFISGSIQFLKEKLQKSEQDLMRIGSVNMRALETYEFVKEEYEKVSEKVKQLEDEREEILKIIHEIDVKKKKTFMKTFTAINELFTRNFSQLSTKGKAFLEIQNPEDIFEGGIDIIIRIAKGKYFDINSLSGGEKTLIALSLIFAIQEYHPYCFYILDEIDAALDKRNSELLANLLHKYMKSGQYIVISHNDSIISGANVIYGISMNSGISKIVSLKLEEGS